MTGRAVRRAIGWGAVLTVAGGLAACGGDGGSADDAFEAVEQQEAARNERQLRVSAPRWEVVETLEGEGREAATVEIADGAIRWRARWSCERGRFQLSADDTELADEACPRKGSETAVETGEVGLAIGASGSWRLTIEQQVETPLREPPLPEIASGDAKQVAEGDFYRIENRGEGVARLFRLPSGRLALRLEGFATAANTDLFVWISEARHPTTTKQVVGAPYVQIAPLKSTLGDQNYVLPEGFDPAAARSVVIWCEPIEIAYTAATLAG